jgi:hypothetical protein
LAGMAEPRAGAGFPAGGSPKAAEGQGLGAEAWVKLGGCGAVQQLAPNTSYVRNIPFTKLDCRTWKG